MKLTETAILRSFMQIITENENQQYDQDKIETILDIADKHENRVYLSQCLGVLGISFKNLDNIKNIIDQIEKLAYKKIDRMIDIVDDTEVMQTVMQKIQGFGTSDLDSEEKEVYNNILSGNPINREVVSAVLLKGFKAKKDRINDEYYISEKESILLTSNTMSLADTTRKAPWHISKKLAKVGVTMYVPQNQKKGAMGLSTGKRKDYQKTGWKSDVSNLMKDVAQSDEGNEARRLVLDLFNERESNIIKASNEVKKDPYRNNIDIEYVLNTTSANLSKDKDFYNSFVGLVDFDGKIPVWVRVPNENKKNIEKALQAGIGISNQVIPKILSKWGILPQNGVWNIR